MAWSRVFLIWLLCEVSFTIHARPRVLDIHANQAIRLDSQNQSESERYMAKTKVEIQPYQVFGNLKLNRTVSIDREMIERALETQTPIRFSVGNFCSYTNHVLSQLFLKVMSPFGGFYLIDAERAGRAIPYELYVNDIKMRHNVTSTVVAKGGRDYSKCAGSQVEDIVLEVPVKTLTHNDEGRYYAHFQIVPEEN